MIFEIFMRTTISSEHLQGKNMKRSKKVSEKSKIMQNPIWSYFSLFEHVLLAFVDASHQLSVLQKISQERNLTEEAFQKLLSESDAEGKICPGSWAKFHLTEVRAG